MDDAARRPSHRCFFFPRRNDARMWVNAMCHPRLTQCARSEKSPERRTTAWTAVLLSPPVPCPNVEQRRTFSERSRALRCFDWCRDFSSGRQYRDCGDSEHQPSSAPSTQGMFAARAWSSEPLCSVADADKRKPSSEKNKKKNTNFVSGSKPGMYTAHALELFNLFKRDSTDRS